MLLQSAWYLDQKFVGECEIPLVGVQENFQGGTAPLALINSTHYISPNTGKVWASVEHLGYDWRASITPGPNEKVSWSQGPGQLWLEWHYGKRVYEPEVMALLPLPVLQLVFNHQWYMYDLERKHRGL